MYLAPPRSSLLLAVDDAVLLESACAALRSLAPTTACAYDAAVDECRTHPPEVLVLAAPQGNTLLLRQIRKYQPDLPIIVLVSTREEQLDAFMAGASEAVELPLDEPLLRVRVQRLLDARRKEHEQEKFLSFLAHDLMQPLGVVSLTVDWLVHRPNLSAEEQEAFEDIGGAGKRLKNMIEDMLALSKLSQVDMAIEPRAISLAGFLSHMESAHRRPLERNGITLTSRCETGLELAFDPKLMARLCDNIIGNARRYARKNILVTARDVGDGVVIDFCNDGSPIAREREVDVFEKFTQHANGCGTLGLGLHFCKLVAELHGGRISVQQTDVWPVVFSVTLPKSVAIAHAS